MASLADIRKPIHELPYDEQVEELRAIRQHRLVVIEANKAKPRRGAGTKSTSPKKPKKTVADKLADMNQAEALKLIQMLELRIKNK